MTPTARGETADERMVLEFFDAWNAADLERILAAFGPDPAYIDMPLPPRRGLAAIRKYIEAVFANYSIRIETLLIGSSGSSIFTERIDHLGRDGREVPLPVAGVMEIKDGKIEAWRDYLDLGTVEDALSITERPWVE